MSKWWVELKTTENKLVYFFIVPKSFTRVVWILVLGIGGTNNSTSKTHFSIAQKNNTSYKVGQSEREKCVDYVPKNVTKWKEDNVKRGVPCTRNNHDCGQLKTIRETFFKVMFIAYRLRVVISFLNTNCRIYFRDA